MWKSCDLLRKKIGTKQLICGILGICIAVIWMWSLPAWRRALVDRTCYELQCGIADEVFRFHVLANSDSDEDQKVKLEVRDAVISYMKKEMPDVDSKSEAASAQATKQWSEQHLKELTQVADQVLEQNGMNYQAYTQVTKCYFPEKYYGDITFPKGEYEALRITLGEAKGHNWWCVLYPNLCFLDATYAVVNEEGKDELKGVLTDDEYQMITDDKELKVKWFFFGD